MRDIPEDEPEDNPELDASIEQWFEDVTLVLAMMAMPPQKVSDRNILRFEDAVERLMAKAGLDSPLIVES